METRTVTQWVALAPPTVLAVQRQYADARGIVGMSSKARSALNVDDIKKTNLKRTFEVLEVKFGNELTVTNTACNQLAVRMD